MIVHHEENRKRMETSIRKAATARKNNKGKNARKCQGYFTQNAACEEKIRSQANIDQSTPLDDENVNILAFTKRYRDELYAFCVVRDSVDILSKKPHIPTNKGKYDPTNLNNNNLVHHAFSVRSKPVDAVLPEEYQQVLNELAAENDGIGGDPPLNENPDDMLEAISGLVVKPKEMTWKIDIQFIRSSCTSFMSLACLGSEFAGNAETQLGSFESNKVAEKFVLPRLASFCKLHGIDDSTYMMQWMEYNSYRVISIAMIHGLVMTESKTRFVGINDSLLDHRIISDTRTTIQIHQQSPFMEQIGTYLLIDKTRGDVIHAGGTCSSFKKCLLKHEKGSKLSTLSSKDSLLYRSYPNIDGDVAAAGHLQRGLWSDVEVKAAVSWKKADTCQVVDLFEWDERTLNMLKENKTTLTLGEKKEQMVVKLFETVLTLCIKELDEISCNPCFDIFKGSFGLLY